MSLKSKGSGLEWGNSIALNIKGRKMYFMYQQSGLSSDWLKMTLSSVTYISQFSFPSRQTWGAEIL